MAKNNETTTKFKVDISELKSAMQEAKRQVALANSEFKAASSGMEAWSKSTDGISAKLKQLDSNLVAQKSVLAQYESTLDEVKAQYGENSKEAQDYQIKLNNQTAIVNTTEKQIKQYKEALDTAEQAEKIAAETGRDATEVFDELGNEAQEAGVAAEQSSGGYTVMKNVLANLVTDGIRLAVDALKEFTKASIQTGMDFESSMSEVGAISGATGEQLQLLEDTAKEYGATTTFSASEAAQALKYMALAGWDAEKSSSALGGVLDLAASAGMDLAQASDMVTDYMSAFGMEASQSTYFADMLAYAQSNANTSAEQLGEAFKNSAANMNAAGQDVETTTALLSMMANQGFKGSEAGTALTAMMRDLTAKMKDGKVMIGDTAVTVQDANGNYRDLTDILKDVESATQGMGDAERATALSTTFTADSTKGLNLLLNAGVGEAEKFEEALRGAGGTAGDMADVMTDNLAGDVKQAQSALEDLQLTAYDELQPALRDIVQYATEKIIPMIKNDVIPVIKDEVIPAIKEFVGWIVDHKDTLIAGIGGIAAAFAAFKVVTLIQSVTAALKGMSLAQAALNAVMALNPIGLVVAAIVGLVAAFVILWNKSEAFREFWINLWNNIQELTGKAVESISKFFTETVPQALDKMVSFLSQLPAKVWKWLLNTITKVSTFKNDMIAKASEAASGFLNKVVEFIKELPSKVWTWLVNTITKLSEWVSDMKAKGKEAIKGLIDKVIEGAKEIPSKMLTIGKNIVDGVWKGIVDAKDQFFENVKGFFSGLVDSAKSALDINSPSKVFAKEVGKWIPEGVAVGINANADSALKSMKNLSAELVGTARAGLTSASGELSTNSSNGGGVINNFYQTNNSPKSLSRLEIYRQTKNLLGYAGGGA